MNIHLIPTDKPSRLGYLTKKGKEVFNDLRLFEKPMPNILDSENQNIYITSDSEIKEGDWCLLDNNVGMSTGFQVLKCLKTDVENGEYDFDDGEDIFSTGRCEKIILTTDQELIKDGVQAIDDDFLNWFVKNPSCEEVEVTYEVLKPFQSEKKGYLIHCPDNEVLEEPKQETLEEAAENYAVKDFNYSINYDAFMKGAKWQQERSYSEEQLYIKLHNLMTDIKFNGLIINDDMDLKKWFNKNKKK